MKDATLAQGNQILNLILQQKKSSDEIQCLIQCGILTDLLNADIMLVDRVKLRKILRPVTFSNIQYTLEMTEEYLVWSELVKFSGINENSEKLIKSHFDISLPSETYNRSKKGNTQIIKLISFAENSNIDTMLQYLKIKKLRPISIREFLLFSMLNFFSEYPIYILDSYSFNNHLSIGSNYLSIEDKNISNPETIKIKSLNKKIKSNVWIPVTDC